MKTEMAIIAAAVSAGLTAACGQKPSDKVAVYKSNMHEGLDVFDLEQGMLSLHSGEVGTRNFPPTEFGGSLEYCSTAQFHCLRTALHVAVPKGEMMSGWSVDGITCAARRQGEAGDVHYVSCRAGPDTQVKFLYSKERGITAYRRICSECEPEVYRLARGTGLFSRKG
jgi:hypothetical protein